MQLTPAERRLLARFVENEPSRRRQVKWLFVPVAAFCMATLGFGTVVLFMLASDAAAEAGVSLWSAWGQPRGALDANEAQLLYLVKRANFTSLLFLFLVIACFVVWVDVRTSKVFYKLARAAVEAPQDQPQRPA